MSYRYVIDKLWNLHAVWTFVDLYWTNFNLSIKTNKIIDKLSINWDDTTSQLKTNRIIDKLWCMQIAWTCKDFEWVSASKKKSIVTIAATVIIVLYCQLEI